MLKSIDQHCSPQVTAKHSLVLKSRFDDSRQRSSLLLRPPPAAPAREVLSTLLFVLEVLVAFYVTY